jgi:hypothetical protein
VTWRTRCRRAFLRERPPGADAVVRRKARLASKKAGQPDAERRHAGARTARSPQKCSLKYWRGVLERHIREVEMARMVSGAACAAGPERQDRTPSKPLTSRRHTHREPNIPPPRAAKSRLTVLSWASVPVWRHKHDGPAEPARGFEGGASLLQDAQRLTSKTGSRWGQCRAGSPRRRTRSPDR